MRLVDDEHAVTHREQAHGVEARVEHAEQRLIDRARADVGEQGRAWSSARNAAHVAVPGPSPARSPPAPNAPGSAAPSSTVARKPAWNRCCPCARTSDGGGSAPSANRRRKTFSCRAYIAFAVACVGSAQYAPAARPAAISRCTSMCAASVFPAPVTSSSTTTRAPREVRPLRPTPARATASMPRPGVPRTAGGSLVPGRRARPRVSLCGQHPSHAPSTRPASGHQPAARCSGMRAVLIPPSRP